MYPYYLDESIPSFRGLWWIFFSFTAFFHRKYLQANGADPDQAPHSAASELGLHCLHNTPKQISGLTRIIVAGMHTSDHYKT